MLDANGARVPYPDLHEKSPRHGDNVYLTIDAKIQEIVENVLYEGVETYQAKHGGAVVMEPQTGRILALAGVSNFDRDDDDNLVRSRSIIPASFMFEPGWIFSAFTFIWTVHFCYGSAISLSLQRHGKWRETDETHYY